MKKILLIISIIFVFFLTGCNTNQENNEKNAINIGDYVKYESDKGTIICRVWDKVNGNIIIMPTEPVGSLTLGDNKTEGAQRVANSATDSLTAVTKINDLCKEYTSSTLGITKGDIESLTVENLNEKIGYVPDEGVRYAYYLSDKVQSGITTEEDGLAGYEKANHASSFKNNIVEPRFYIYDYAKNTAEDENGNIYAYPTETDPVFVTHTYYIYSPSIISEDKVYSDMLGETDGWLASQSVYSGPSGSCFSVRDASNKNVSHSDVCYSFGNTYSKSQGVRPLICISSKLKLNSNIEGMDGTQDNPWQLKK